MTKCKCVYIGHDEGDSDACSACRECQRRTLIIPELASQWEDVSPPLAQSVFEYALGKTVKNRPR